MPVGPVFRPYLLFSLDDFWFPLLSRPNAIPIRRLSFAVVVVYIDVDVDVAVAKSFRLHTVHNIILHLYEQRERGRCMDGEYAAIHYFART